MASSTSSDQEFQTVDNSPERLGTSNASSGDYHSAPEHTHVTNPFQHQANTIDIGPGNPSSSTRQALNITRREVDVTVPPPATTGRHRHSILSAEAPAFMPLRRIAIISEEAMSTVSYAYSTSSSPPSRPIYDNQVPGIPSHWIPIYGARHGIFYDPVTKMFYNDGPPRPTLERPDGTTQPIDDSVPAPRIGLRQQDIPHLQPPSLTAPIVRTLEANRNALRRYYCRCRDAWLADPHDCPDEGQLEEQFIVPAAPMGLIPGAIRPTDFVPPEALTHDIVIGDLSYLTPGERYAYESGLRVGGIVVVPFWLGNLSQGMRMRGGRMWSGASEWEMMASEPDEERSVHGRGRNARKQRRL